MSEGISIREFARRAGCDEKVVRRKVKTQHVQLLGDGSIDPRYLEVDWRKGDSLAADNADNADNADGNNDFGADTKDIRAEVASLVSADGAELWSKADAQKVKENYAARLKQLEYDREIGKVVEIDDVVVAVASEYAVVRNRLLGIGSKIAPDLTTLQSADEIKAIIDAEVIEALNQLTVDVDGERDFDRLRESLQSRFGPTDREAPQGPQ
ncbi:hypothetical protein [Rhizobium tumorigenes]|uniref:hypothetical protein n=1 Tax=Rhizobium tumorigenes TaxID=2041385 RepID=UPI00241D9D17|nr:hypothetical protein [Rhizobium tumorigenes]WFS02785.1 hypothetical protein PR016_09360 [Rhizobium tumorigenes]